MAWLLDVLKNAYSFFRDWLLVGAVALGVTLGGLWLWEKHQTANLRAENKELTAQVQAQVASAKAETHIITVTKYVKEAADEAVKAVQAAPESCDNPELDDAWAAGIKRVREAQATSSSPTGSP